MKTKVIVIVASLFISGAAMAQAGVQFGGKLGANLGKIDSKSFKEEYNLSYHAGGFS